MANADDKTKKVVEGKLLAGERVTEADVKQLTGWKAKLSKPSVIGIDDLISQFEQVISKQSISQLRSRCLQLKKTNLELDQQIKALKSQLKEKA